MRGTEATSMDTVARELELAAELGLRTSLHVDVVGGAVAALSEHGLLREDGVRIADDRPGAGRRPALPRLARLHHRRRRPLPRTRRPNGQHHPQQGRRRHPAAHRRPDRLPRHRSCRHHRQPRPLWHGRHRPRRRPHGQTRRRAGGRRPAGAADPAARITRPDRGSRQHSTRRPHGVRSRYRSKRPRLREGSIRCSIPSEPGSARHVNRLGVAWSSKISREARCGWPGCRVLPCRAGRWRGCW